MKIMRNNNVFQYCSGCIPPQLDLPDTHFKRVRNGSRGIVFRISEHYAGKVLYSGDCFKDTENFTIRNDEEAVSLLEHEVEIAGYLHDYECNAPKPVGVEKIPLLTSTSTTYPVYIMDYLPFPSGADLGYHEFLKAQKSALDEIAKTIDCGFIQKFPKELRNDVLNPNNYLWDRINQKVYLIDFEFWEFNNESEKFQYTANL